MGIVIRILGRGDEQVLERCAEDVFDNPVDAALAREFLDDERHHLAVAIDGDIVVGMASAVDYVHPDKPRELWINEVGVASTHHRQGIARRLLGALFERGRERGCRQAWVLTHRSNAAAMRLYQSAGGVIDEEDPTMFTFDLGGGI